MDGKEIESTSVVGNIREVITREREHTLIGYSGRSIGCYYKYRKMESRSLDIFGRTSMENLSPLRSKRENKKGKHIKTAVEKEFALIERFVLFVLVNANVSNINYRPSDK